MVTLVDYSIAKEIGALPDTQKLIYGGKLLRDGDTLTQALRQFKVGEKPIIHMVCSTLLTTDQKKNQKEIETSTEQQPTETPSQLSLPTTANENQTISNDSLPTTANENQTISNASLPTTANESQTTSSDGLRNRMPGTNFPPQFPFASGTLGNWQFPSPVDNQPVIRPAEVAHAAAAAASSAYWSYYYWYMYYNAVGNNRPSNVRYQSGYLIIQRLPIRRPVQNENAENVRNEGEQNLADNNSDARENESGDVNNANVNQELEPESPPSFMFVARSFIVSFFTSLIPQNPEAA
ncbi:uncharacterized protein TRIADDRAFT_52603 [Trichoplax adhaerens]|uniref:Ubiquitin-like domain-containing protein n=1 Tax=Trichoplax adhaerens TaxID=10228 RepID=B3RJF3_TRIAD|nr:hypothetical protein TRIADDRAFT_52603 [Trichoplax adhaerens]EDV29082.1 hypothetical protein TRIADDRAFT_52603 [Trichoplax adhaerens]|eukprot:XP_002108284.1 hypothetical protein TRIADDRAFT_52603 [Trichoplax adhaerens]